MRLKRRQPQAKWTPAEVAGDIAAAYIGDADQYAVRAAVVVRYAYERLPKSVVDEWKADAEKEQPGRGMPSHGVFQFDFSDDDRVALYMDHDKSAVIRDVVTVYDGDDAAATVIQWVGESGREVGLENLPGVYLSALIEASLALSAFGTSTSWRGGCPVTGHTSRIASTRRQSTRPSSSSSCRLS